MSSQYFYGLPKFPWGYEPSTFKLNIDCCLDFLDCQRSHVQKLQKSGASLFKKKIFAECNLSLLLHLSLLRDNMQCKYKVTAMNSLNNAIVG